MSRDQYTSCVDNGTGYYNTTTDTCQKCPSNSTQNPNWGPSSTGAPCLCAITGQVFDMSSNECKVCNNYNPVTMTCSTSNRTKMIIGVTAGAIILILLVFLLKKLKKYIHLFFLLKNHFFWP